MIKSLAGGTGLSLDFIHPNNITSRDLVVWKPPINSQNVLLWSLSYAVNYCLPTDLLNIILTYNEELVPHKTVTFDLTQRTNSKFYDLTCACERLTIQYPDHEYISTANLTNGRAVVYLYADRVEYPSLIDQQSIEQFNVFAFHRTIRGSPGILHLVHCKKIMDRVFEFHIASTSEHDQSMVNILIKW